jgi:hypothetical protein
MPAAAQQQRCSRRSLLPLPAQGKLPAAAANNPYPRAEQPTVAAMVASVLGGQAIRRINMMGGGACSKRKVP